MSVFEVEQATLPKPNYEYINNSEDVGRALEEILKYDTIEVDTETTGFDPYTKKIVLVQIGIPNKSFVFDPRCATEHSSVHIDQLEPVLNNKNILKLLQNAVFDMKMLKVHAGYYLENIYDTMLVEQLFNLGISVRGASLADLVQKYLGLVMIKEPAGTFQDYGQKFKPYQLEYAAGDVAILSLIRDLQAPRIKSEGFENVCRLEFEFTKPICEMELNGITLDVEKWRLMMQGIDEERVETLHVIQEMLTKNHGQNVMFGVPVINLDSPKQLLTALNGYGLSLEGTSEAVLKKYKDVPVIASLLSYRKQNKLISTYGESLIEKINPVTGRLHTKFRQMIATGRLSSSSPNLQNIPKKQKFRSCFIAKPGYSLITADMDSAELKILGNLSEDPVFVECFSKGIDLHSRSASEVFKVPFDEVDKKMRDSCKALTFGLCISEDTQVITDQGIKKISSVNRKDVISHDLGMNKVIDSKYMGKKEVFEIKTRYGYTIEVTSDHVLKVIDCMGNYVDKKLSDINTDEDQVCIKLGTAFFPKTNFIFKPFDIKKRTNFKDFKLPSELNNNWAAFLGLIVSEGHLGKNKAGNYGSIQVGISKKDTEFIEYIDQLFDRLFVTYSRQIYGDMVSYSINSVKVTQWVRSILSFDTGDKTNTVDIPQCVKRSPKELQISFLRTLYEGDGTIYKQKNTFCISYSSRSLKLMKSLQTMLLNFGTLSSIYDCPDKRYPNNKYYTLDIIGIKSKLKFMDDIGFITNRKNNKASHKSPFKRSYFNITFPKEKLKLLQHKISLDRKNVSDGSLDTCNWYLYNNLKIYNRYYINNSYFDTISKYDESVKFINDNDIVTLPIVSIKPKGIKKVYDISVDKHPYFLANGFIVHNCYGLSKYGLAAQLNISEKDAQDLINNYFDVFKTIKQTLNDSAREAIKLGYSVEVSGRKRFYNIPPYGHPDRKKIQKSVERKAKNMPVQAANASTLKEAMILLVRRLDESGYDARLLLNVHDEAVVEVRNDQIAEVVPIVESSIVDGFATYFSKIPMTTTGLISPTWLKSECECGCTKMELVPDKKTITKLVCSKCGAEQE